MEPVNYISPSPIPQSGAKNTQAVQKKYSAQDVTAAASLTGKDQASLSESAKILAKAYQELNDTPETRAELVAAIREQIEAGEYSVPYDKLAEILTKRLYKKTT